MINPFRPPHRPQPHLVLGLTWQAVKMALLSKININQHPELVVILSEHEDINQFINVAPEVNLLRSDSVHPLIKLNSTRLR